MLDLSANNEIGEIGGRKFLPFRGNQELGQSGFGNCKESS